MNLADAKDLVVTGGQMVVAAGAMYGVVRAAVRPVKKKLTTEIAEQVAEQVTPVASDLAEVKGQMALVKAELSPNSGHSIKDVVDRTEDKVDALGQRFNDHLINHPRG